MLGIGSVSYRSILAKASTCMYLLPVCHSSFCSNGPAPTGRAIEASFGTMPTTSARRSSSSFKRAMGLVKCCFFRCCPEKVIKAIIDRHVMFAGVHRFRQLGPSGAQSIGHLAPHLTGGRAATATLCRRCEIWASAGRIQCTRQRVTDALDGVLKAAMGADRQFGAFRPSGVEAAQEVHPEEFCLGWPKPEADDLSLPVSRALRQR